MSRNKRPKTIDMTRITTVERQVHQQSEVVIAGRWVAYGLLRSLADILTQLGDNSLELHLDGAGLWYWRWRSFTPSLRREAESGFNSLGEAVIDALVWRYPASFACPYPFPNLELSPRSPDWND